jgi:hypothetical protein
MRIASGCGFLVLAKLLVERSCFAFQTLALALDRAEIKRDSLLFFAKRSRLHSQLLYLALESEKRCTFLPRLRARHYQATIDHLLAFISDVDARRIFD